VAEKGAGRRPTWTQQTRARVARISPDGITKAQAGRCSRAEEAAPKTGVKEKESPMEVVNGLTETTTRQTITRMAEKTTTRQTITRMAEKTAAGLRRVMGREVAMARGKRSVADWLFISVSFP
jgi:hypothetical protein